VKAGEDVKARQIRHPPKLAFNGAAWRVFADRVKSSDYDLDMHR
jgi:hypothetical protein